VPDPEPNAADEAYTERYVTLQVFNRAGHHVRLNVDPTPGETLQLGIQALAMSDDPDEEASVWFRRDDIPELIKALQAAESELSD